jgi:DNA-binding SARP family transcriptional activator
MTPLKLFFLGPPRLEQAGQSLAVRRRKGLALLAYLAVTNRSQHRDTLATLFWPAAPQRRARGNLRQVLSDLNKVLDSDWLLVDGEQIRLAQHDDLWLDVARFHACLELNQAHDHQPDEICSICLPLLREAADLYRADFLAGFTLPNTPEFDDWQFFQAESLRQDLALVLERLVRGYTGQEDYETAISYARRWLSLDPLHEPAHCALMRLYAWSGQQSAALRQYEECVRLLDDEFGLPPEQGTTTLYEAIKARRLVKAVYKEREQEGGRIKRMATSESPPLPHFLEEETSPELAPVFVARERELSDLEAALATARTGQGQILFVIGGAGRGKTVLAQEFARRVQATDDNLVVVSGYCDAMTGIGDPYLPFRGALTMLTGEVEAKWTGGLISQTHARRLWALMPLTLSLLVQHAPDLIGNFVPAEALQARVATLAPLESPWFKQLATLATRAYLYPIYGFAQSHCRPTAALVHH